jgi:hypothetical protein
MANVIETDVELDAEDFRKLEALARKLAAQKKAKTVQETVPPENRVYVMGIELDSIMTTSNAALATTFKGTKNCEALLRQLEKKYGKKFYMEETKPIITIKN